MQDRSDKFLANLKQFELCNQNEIILLQRLEQLKIEDNIKLWILSHNR